MRYLSINEIDVGMMLDGKTIESWHVNDLRGWTSFGKSCHFATIDFTDGSCTHIVVVQ